MWRECLLRCCSNVTSANNASTLCRFGWNIEPAAKYLALSAERPSFIYGTVCMYSTFIHYTHTHSLRCNIVGPQMDLGTDIADAAPEMRCMSE